MYMDVTDRGNCSSEGPNDLPMEAELVKHAARTETQASQLPAITAWPSSLNSLTSFPLRVWVFS